jgi:glycosyltransferase involved in cell wall biosynthesis
MLGNWLQTIHRARQISRILRHEKPEAIVSCSGDPYDLPAGFLASRWTGIRFYAYLFDDYLHQWSNLLDRRFAEKWERILMEGGERVIVPNEFLAEAYADRYGIKPTVIHNPSEQLEIDSGPDESWPADPGKISIIYTGAIYHAHYNAFQNLLAAIRRMKEPEFRLHLYTSQSPLDLERQNIQGPVDIHPHLPISRAAQIQQRADILFLPLAFDSPFPEIIRTAAPGKMGEYLSSGRPILVHAPLDSFVSWYFRKNACGFLVEQNDPTALVHALQHLVKEASLREALVRNALLCAKRDFGLRRARTEFLKVLQPSLEGEVCASSS